MKISEKITQKLDLPAEASLDMIKLVITGDREVLVENYKGIAEYTSEVVRLASVSGIVRISGSNLLIKSISAEEIVLSGKIKAVEIE